MAKGYAAKIYSPTECLGISRVVIFVLGVLGWCKTYFWSFREKNKIISEKTVGCEAGGYSDIGSLQLHMCVRSQHIQQYQQQQ